VSVASSSARSPRRSTPPPRRRDEARALFRNAILEAAEHVFGERGFHRARIQDVAARARIAVGTVYNHFAHKDEVLRALMEERTEAMLGELEPRPGDPADFEEMLAHRIARMLGYVEAHREFFALAAEQGVLGASSASATALGGKAAKNVSRARAAFLALVEEGVAAGVLDGSDPVVLARTLGGIVRAVVLGALQDGAESIASSAPLVARLFVHGAAVNGAIGKTRGASRASKRPR
jgi:AcrR family transcriptional regulator